MLLFQLLFDTYPSAGSKSTLPKEKSYLPYYCSTLCKTVMFYYPRNFFFPEQIYLSISGLSLEWDETYVELLVTASKLQRQLVYAKEEEPAKVEMLERKISR